MMRDRDKAARELIAFYLEAGVDALVGETPVDRFADASPPPERGRHRRPSAAVLSAKNADAEHRLWSAASRVGVGAGDATLPLPGSPSAIRPAPKGEGEKGAGEICGMRAAAAAPAPS